MAQQNNTAQGNITWGGAKEVQILLPLPEENFT